MPRMGALLGVLVAPFMGCSGDGGSSPPDPVAVAELTGPYHVELRTTSQVNPMVSCRVIHIQLAPPPVTWNPEAVGCADEPDLVEVAAGDTLRLYEWDDLFEVSRVILRFTDFRGTTERVTADWRGPCTKAVNPGNPIGCYVESGTSTWVPE